MANKAVPEKTRVRRRFLLALLFLFLYLVYLLFRPYLGTMVFAVVLTSVFYPVHGRVSRRCRGRRNLAALISATLLVLIVVVPLASFSAALLNQGAHSLARVNAWLSAGNLDRLFSWEKLQPLRKMADRYLALLGLEPLSLGKILMDASSGLGRLILSHGTELLSNVTALAVRFALMIILVFYFLRDGRGILERLQKLSPLSTEQEERLIQRIRTLSRSVVLANAATAGAQGVVGGIGLWISGIPALFWGTMMAFASLVPAVGTALVWVPAVCYLLALGLWGKAIFLSAWCVVLVGSIDSIGRPYLLKDQESASSIYLFLAILGGVQLFGIAGILYGPLILGVAAVLVFIYELEYRDILADD